MLVIEEFISSVNGVFVFFLLNIFAFVLTSCDFLSSPFILFFNLQGILSLTMSSFMSNFAIDMGGNDSEGSIQQPPRTMRSFPLVVPPQMILTMVLLTMNPLPQRG